MIGHNSGVMASDNSRKADTKFSCQMNPFINRQIACRER
jgi:hypothetical protein